MIRRKQVWFSNNWVLYGKLTDLFPGWRDTEDKTLNSYWCQCRHSRWWEYIDFQIWNQSENDWGNPQEVPSVCGLQWQIGNFSERNVKVGGKRDHRTFYIPHSNYRRHSKKAPMWMTTKPVVMGAEGPNHKADPSGPFLELYSSRILRVYCGLRRFQHSQPPDNLQTSVWQKELSARSFKFFDVCVHFHMGTTHQGQSCLRCVPLTMAPNDDRDVLLISPYCFHIALLCRTYRWQTSGMQRCNHRISWVRFSCLFSSVVAVGGTATNKIPQQ